MLTCKELTRFVAADEIATRSLWQRAQFRLHLLLCRHCRNYVSQIRLLGASARRRWRGTDPPPPSVRNRVTDAVLAEIDQQRDD